jgi:hypothetical protein
MAIGCGAAGHHRRDFLAREQSPLVRRAKNSRIACSFSSRIAHGVS